MSEEEVTLDAPTVEYLNGLYERDGKLTAESVLADAQDPASILHKRFEWDDANAAHQWRLTQAREICRAHITVEKQRVRAFVFVKSAGTYAPLREAMERTDWRDEVLATFKRDADAFAARWKAHKFAATHYRDWVLAQAAEVA